MSYQPDVSYETEVIFEPGVTRTFGNGDLRDQILLSGWAGSEDNHVWNDGIEAALAIRLDARPEETMILRVEGVPFVSGRVPKQDVTLFVNGFRLGFWRLETMDKSYLNARIEPEQWFIRDGLAYAHCVWFLPDSMRPCDVTGADDRREIGFCFQSIAVTAV